MNIAYAFGNADKLNDSDITHRHAIIQLHDHKKGLSGKGPGHVVPTGMQDIGTGDKKSWQYLGHHSANTCVNRPGNAFDGHASANLAAFWSVLGAARSDDPEKLRAYFNYMKTFLILSENPSRLGASSRPARELQAGNQALLDESLLTALAELNHANELKPLPMGLSKARSPVWLASVGNDRKLIFQAMKSDKQASFDWADLNQSDHALLARLVARARPTDKEAQATAGIYVELTGDTDTADNYFENAGTEVSEQLDGLFE